MNRKLALVFTAVSILGIATPTWAEEGSWSQAGKEIGEAADAVGDATVESSKDAWDATKRGSSAAWKKTKEVSSDAWDATKGAVHDGAEYVEEKTAD